jgi:hypothetical protein
MKIEQVGDVVHVNEFWDCECADSNYIHRKSEMPMCAECGAKHEDSPDSRLDEILIYCPFLLTMAEREQALRWFMAYIP